MYKEAMTKEEVAAIIGALDGIGYAIDKIEYNRRDLTIAVVMYHKPEEVSRGGALETLREAALEQNPALADCTADSLSGALLQTAHLRLNLDQVRLIPQRNEETGVLECIFKLTEPGLAELRSRRE